MCNVVKRCNSVLFSRWKIKLNEYWQREQILGLSGLLFDLGTQDQVPILLPIVVVVVIEVVLMAMLNKREKKEVEFKAVTD